MAGGPETLQEQDVFLLILTLVFMFKNISIMVQTASLVILNRPKCVLENEHS